MATPIWTPSPERVADANLTAFLASVNQRYDAGLDDYADLHAFSIARPGDFWAMVWDFCGVRGERGERTVVDPQLLPGATWFPDARLNIAETLLGANGESLALVALREDGVRLQMTFAELAARVSLWAQLMSDCGVQAGDRVAAYMPSCADAIAAMVATVSLGAVWCACAPEYAVDAALDRLAQVEPKLLIGADGYLYGGKRFDLLDRLGEMSRALPDLAGVIVVPVLSPAPDLSGIIAGSSARQALAAFKPKPMAYPRFPFNHPAFILFSSGTTGAPKAIVHSAGGALIENLKSHVLHFDVKPRDIVYMASTTGWVVWIIQSMALGGGACIVLYDGSPSYPNPDQLFVHTAQERATLARYPARYIEALAKAGSRPGEMHDLTNLRTMMGNGSVFPPASYEYVYEHVKRDMHVISPVGGTDVCGSLVSANPIGPVYPGEIQGPALGLKIEVLDEAGRSMTRGQGELCVTQSFPTVPLRFWNDPQGARFHDAYFNRFANVWRHGDWAEFTENRGVIIHGRSDSTLNARGVRIGAAEIYRCLDDMPEVLEALAVGQAWQGDSRVVLFLRLAPGAVLDAALQETVRESIRRQASPRHVPALIIAVPELPVTVTGKASEAAVHAVIHGRPVANLGSLANPQALRYFNPDAMTALQS